MRRADYELLKAAFPLDHQRVDSHTIHYVGDPGSNMGYEPPFNAFLHDRLIIHRHMRLAFEEGATWLVEMLDGERASVFAQAAFACVLEQEAGLRQ